ncbi:MAG: flagellar biosynthetic protein FliR [Eubacteriales bacterium]
MSYIYTWFANWDYLLLLLLRVSALIFTSPIFGRKNIPVIARIGYCACITYLFFITMPHTQPIDYHDDILLFVLLCVKELLFGLVIGFVLNLFFTLVFTSGQLMDMQMGFGIGSVYNPQNNINVPMVGNFLNLIMLIVFFAMNGHHRLIQILYLTVVKIPVGQVSFSTNITWVAVELFVQTFALAVSIALPIIISGLLAQALLGVMVRSVPQINAFAIGLPLEVMIGLVVLLAMLPVYINFLPSVFDQMYIGLDNMFGALMGG